MSDAIDAAYDENRPASIQLIDRFKKEWKNVYYEYESMSVVSSDTELIAEIFEFRGNCKGLYLDAVKCQNPGSDFQYGSNENDRFYWRAVVKYWDLLLERCFSEKNSAISNGSNGQIGNESNNLINTYQTLKKIVTQLYISRLTWAVNQESGKPLKAYFSPDMTAFLGDDVCNWQTIKGDLEDELNSSAFGCRDYKLMTENLSNDILDFLFNDTVIPDRKYSLLSTFQAYSQHEASRREKANELYKNKNLSIKEQLFEDDFHALLYIKTALYDWASVLIRHINRHTPAIFQQYEMQLREYIDCTFISPQPEPATEIKLTHAQIAIYYHLEGWPINENNATTIAQKYGQTSGKKLANTYKELTSELTRTEKGKYTVKNYLALKSLISDNAKADYNKELEKARKNNQKN